MWSNSSSTLFVFGLFLLGKYDNKYYHQLSKNVDYEKDQTFAYTICCKPLLMAERMGNRVCCARMVGDSFHIESR